MAWRFSGRYTGGTDNSSSTHRRRDAGGPPPVHTNFQRWLLTDSATRTAELPCRILVGSLDHDADDLLSSRWPQQDSARITKLGPRPPPPPNAPTARRHRGLVRDLHIDQHLRQGLHRRGQRRQRGAGLRHSRHQPQPGDDAVSSRAERRHDDVSRLLTAKRILARPQLFEHVAVADAGGADFDARRAHGQVQPEVAHHGRHQTCWTQARRRRASRARGSP